MGDPALLGAAAGFSPLSLLPVAWYDASDAATITSSAGKVSQWNDKSGNNWHVVQATSSAQPLTGTFTRNGKNVIYFDGNDFLKRTNVSGLATGASAIYVVFEFPAAVNAGSIVQLRNGSNNVPILTMDGFQTEVFGRRRNDSSGVATTTASTTRGYQYATVFYDGTNIVYRRNGVQVGSVASTGNTSLNLIELGANPFSIAVEGNFMTGSIAEVVITATASLSDRSNMESYLAVKWGF